jgi:hypothetical protein
VIAIAPLRRYTNSDLLIMAYSFFLATRSGSFSRNASQKRNESSEKKKDAVPQRCLRDKKTGDPFAKGKP